MILGWNRMPEYSEDVPCEFDDIWETAGNILYKLLPIQDDLVLLKSMLSLTSHVARTHAEKELCREVAHTTDELYRLFYRTDLITWCLRCPRNATSPDAMLALSALLEFHPEFVRVHRLLTQKARYNRDHLLKVAAHPACLFIFACILFTWTCIP